MITAPAGLVARYKHQGKEQRWSCRRVVAFDDDLQPLVISDDHRLEHASRYSNFDGIEDKAGPEDVGYSAIMPAGGWRGEFTGRDGSKWDQPLVGWALKNGMVVPLAADCTGLVDDLDSYSGDYRIYHPDEREIPASGGTAGNDPDGRQQLEGLDAVTGAPSSSRSEP